MKRNYRIIAASGYDSVRDLCHDVKSGLKPAIEQAAKMLAPLVPEMGFVVLIPVPGHEGTAKYTLELAQAIERETKKYNRNVGVVDCLVCDPHPSLCELKRKGGDPADIELNVRFRDQCGEDVFNKAYQAADRFVLVDNVVDTGLTARSCMDVVDDCDVLCIGNTLRDTQAQFYPDQPGKGVPVFVHFQNIEDDSTLFDIFCDKVYLPCCPAIGDTFFADWTTQRNVLRKILRYKENLNKWANCVADRDRSPFLSFQEFFYVVDRWFRGSDGSVHILLNDSPDNRKATRTPPFSPTDEQYREMLRNFRKGNMWL